MENMDHNAEKHLPKYAVIEQDLAEKIESGGLPGVTSKKCRESAPESKAAHPCRSLHPYTVTPRKFYGTA